MVKWINFNCGMKLLIHFQMSMATTLMFGMDKQSHSTIYDGLTCYLAMMESKLTRFRSKRGSACFQQIQITKAPVTKTYNVIKQISFGYFHRGVPLLKAARFSTIWHNKGRRVARL